MRQLLTIIAALLGLCATAYAGDMKHPSLPPPVHSGEPCILGSPCGGGGGGGSNNNPINPTLFPGSDIGMQINNAIAANPTGGQMLIPAGMYPFSTTIQCPVGGTTAYIISGAGRAHADGTTSGGTVLSYTGAGDAINQVVTDPSKQNTTGCVLRDFTLDGSGAGSSAIGWHFGGTAYSASKNVEIQLFKQAGIEVEDASGLYTNRSDIDSTLWHNALGLYLHCDAGCVNPNSYDHSSFKLKVSVLTQFPAANEGIKSDGNAYVANDDFNLAGNVEGTGSGGILIHAAGTSTWINNTYALYAQCDQSGGCTRVRSESGTSFRGNFTNALPSAPFPWSDNTLGAFVATYGYTVNNNPDYFYGTVNGVLNVMNFGARCDGTTDDTVAIQNAINASQLTTAVPAILIPYTGHNCVVSQLNLTNLINGFELRGEKHTNQTPTPATISGLLCKEAVNDVGVCIDTSGSWHWSIQDLSIESWQGGVNVPKVMLLMGKTCDPTGTPCTFGSAASVKYNGQDSSLVDVDLHTNGDYTVYNYGNEVFSATRSTFTGGNIATLVVSSMNTAGIASPWATLVTGPNSMTATSYRDDTFGCFAGTYCVQIDVGAGGTVSDLTFDGGYINNGTGQLSLKGAFDVTGTSGGLNRIAIMNMRNEPQQNDPLKYFFKSMVPVHNIQMTNITFANTVPETVSPIQFLGTPTVSVASGNIDFGPGDGQGVYAGYPNNDVPLVTCAAGSVGLSVHMVDAAGGPAMPLKCNGAVEIGNYGVSGASFNNVVNPEVYGAKGDAIYSGDGLHGSDGALPTATTFSSPKIAANQLNVGQTIFVDSAGPGVTAYLGTITAVNDSTQVMTVSPAFSNGIGTTGATYAIGTDNTTALQNWINAMRNTASSNIGLSGYVPLGNYLERGLDFTGVGGYKITGSGQGIAYTAPHRSGTNFLCIMPAANPNGGPNVCHDFTGNDFTTIRDMSFQSGVSVQSAGAVNFLLARKEVGPRFGILNTIERIGFRAFGHYNVVNVDSEQNDWIDDFFNENGDPAIAFYLSQANTPGFTSQYIGLLNGNASTTLNRFYGGASQFSADGAGTAFVIDGNPADLTIDGAYVRLAQPADNFVTDSGPGSVCSDCSFNNLRVEPSTDNPTNTPSNQFVHFMGAWNGGTAINDIMAWAAPAGGIAAQKPMIEAANLSSVHTINFQEGGGTPFTYPNPTVKYTTGADNFWGNINAHWIAGPVNAGVEMNFDGLVGAATIFGRGTPSVSGGSFAGSTHATSVAGEVVASSTSVTLTPGYGCNGVDPNAHVVGFVADQTHAGGPILPLMTGRSATTLTWQAIIGDVYDYAGMSCG